MRGVGKGEVEKGIRKRRVKREGGREAGKIEWVDGCDGCVVMRKLSPTQPFLRHTRRYTLFPHKERIYVCAVHIYNNSYMTRIVLPVIDQVTTNTIRL